MNYRNDFKQYVQAFAKLLSEVNIESISPEPYCKRYLEHILSHKEYYLAVYADVLKKMMTHSGKLKNEISLLDFGAGNGLLGIFAKFCGFKKVFINDIDAKFAEACKKLAEKLKMPIDGFITGNIHAVNNYFTSEVPDAVIGTDVIEHIYDLEDFYTTLKTINPCIISVFTTASNPKNYFKIRRIKKIQVKDEHEGGTPADAVLFGEKELEPFIRTREKIIRSQLENSPAELIYELAAATRGLNEGDILAAIHKFKLTGKKPLLPTHSTNTCDPVTGSWTERILSIPSYKSLYEAAGFQLKIYNGFYDEYKASGIRSVVNKVLNLAIFAGGIYISPYIIFLGFKK